MRIADRRNCETTIDSKVWKVEVDVEDGLITIHLETGYFIELEQDGFKYIKEQIS